MKFIALAILLALPAALFAEESLVITKKHTEYQTPDGKSVRTIRDQTFRSGKKIRDQFQRDNNGDGKMDWFGDSFCVDGEVVYSISVHDGKTSTSLFSHRDTQVLVEESDRPGHPVSVAFFNKDGIFIEVFRRREGGSLEPVSAQELSEGISQSRKHAPMMNSILDLIDTNDSQQGGAGNGRPAGARP